MEPVNNWKNRDYSNRIRELAKVGCDGTHIDSLPADHVIQIWKKYLFLPIFITNKESSLSLLNEWGLLP